MRYAGDVCAYQKDAAADGQTDSLIENQLGDDIAPDEIRADAEPGFLLIFLVIILLLHDLHYVALDLGQDFINPHRVTSREAILEDELDNIADLRADKAVDSELYNLLLIEG
ncbi:hypothetical protein HG531_001539 [Fusarium graminearum]|nr:hypothetical protein HG531_001539 [Fusarium graminearum]